MEHLELYYDKPAAVWEETLPVGNGSLGGMVFGGIQKEVIGLNEESLWSGYPREKDNPGAYASLDTVRGTVSVGWERKGEEIVLRVTVPGNTNLTVRAQGRTLRCRGLEGKNMLRLGNGEFQIEIGEYDEKTQETDDYDDVPAYDGEPRRWLYAGK